MERMPLWELAVKRLEMSVPRFLLLYVLPRSWGRLRRGPDLIVATGGLGPNSILGGVIGGSMLFILPLVTGQRRSPSPSSRSVASVTGSRRRCTCSSRAWGSLSLGEIGANSMFDILKQMSDYGNWPRRSRASRSWWTNGTRASRRRPASSLIRVQAPSGRTSSTAWPSPWKQANPSMCSCALSSIRR